MDFSSLRAEITNRSKAVLVVHPNNPTGSFVHLEEGRELAQLCAEREMTIVADEVFLDFADREPQPSFASGSPALTFTLSGISKISLLPQMKIAWIAVTGPEGLRSSAMSRLEIIADTYLSPSTPSQVALPELLCLREEMQHQMAERVRSNLEWLDQSLDRPLPNALEKGSAASRLKREGGWYAVLRVPAVAADEQLAISLLRDFDVLVHPGAFFDFRGGAYFVLSLISPQSEFRDGVQRLNEFLNRI